jgi:flagellar M-ring protein FliF
MSSEQIATWWKAQDSRRRSLYVISAVAIVIVLVSAAYYATRVEYAPLFSNLDPEQANSIVESLRQENVQYRLSDGGTTVLVPSKQLYDIRIRVAGEGLYNSGVGFELFDQVQLGITDFERRLNYQRALQEELRRTITNYPAVEQARVHLVLPEPTVFAQRAAPASASVTLRLRPFHSLSAEQVKSIVYLVALGVPNLKPENVAIVDVNGRILTAGLGLGENGEPAALRQAERQRDFERTLEDRLVQMLERIHGPGRAVAVVTAQMNFDAETVTRIVYDSEGQVVRSEQVREETFTGPAGTVGGVAGTGSNIPIYPTAPATGEGTSTYQSSERTVQYEIGRTETTQVIAPGRVERLSAAVSVNAPLTPEETARLEQLVRAALGLDNERGDSVHISAGPFNEEHLAAAERQLAELTKREQLQAYIRYGVIGTSVLLAFILLMVLVARLRKTRFDVPATEGVQLVSLKQALAEAAAARTNVEANVALEKVKELAKQQPEEVAQLVKAWFNEG